VIYTGVSALLLRKERAEKSPALAEPFLK
jgi:hypothetical protein